MRTCTRAATSRLRAGLGKHVPRVARTRGRSTVHRATRAGEDLRPAAIRLLSSETSTLSLPPVVDLWSARCSTALPLVHPAVKERAADVPRFDSAFLVGARMGDHVADLPGPAAEARRAVGDIINAAAAQGREVTEQEGADFVALARSVLLELGKPDCAAVSLRVSEDAVFFGESSPAAALFDEVMRKCLRTVFVA